jgi:hypothetical protein
MNLFIPVHRPRVGLSFTGQGIALVELRRAWRKPVITRVRERPLSDGVLRPSATEPNICDRETVEKELRALLQNTSERTLAICLPDQACHLAVFPFETVPPRERERNTILRWRFQHEEHVVLGGDAQILHRVFSVPRPSRGANTTTKQDGQVTAYVLAMAIKRSVLEQYQWICEQVGLLPASISCAALWLFDFYRPAMSQAAELFFVHQAADSMTCFAIRQGLPVFCRSKARRRGQVDLRSEIRSTVQFYDDLYPRGGTEPNSGPIHLYMVGDGPSWTDLGEGGLDQQASSEPWSPGEQTPWQVQPIQPDWRILVGVRSEVVQTAEGLCALACAVGR